MLNYNNIINFILNVRVKYFKILKNSNRNLEYEYILFDLCCVVVIDNNEIKTCHNNVTCR